ncbi:eukaryotic peptide chain release factor GTP-binding subunit ERF3A isoform X2 [Tribolium castaneum]|uniref:Eukaryotic peptide chain release factor GTP-binding subunit n=1 Tax=Tribolium castaneum TaxID=7070 RepID=D6WYX3_TRICA|nr:PREDICTED: eukaryotic peptide chain release factor GTP-binding subunit ERF3A isoform X2 [Tribolium castaneum]EFA09020.1 Elongation factor 1-alpha 1-like Protein [Tribolium castaneum]|eukprot:XP_968773.1 PREDICTED: eukaryotic peptide chain release factor GTP-binding subunit ERF3A isoform X2 [Tribolium castaneum]
MSNNTAPDSWESQADSASPNTSPSHNADVTAKFSTLNVNAVEFVPSFAKPAANADEASPTSEASPEHAPILNGTSAESAERVEVKEPPPIPPADGDASPGDGGTWEDVVVEDNDPLITPEADDDEPSSEEAPIKIPKKKTVKEEVLKDKKEHVNVVFIGHVDAGKSTIGGQIMALTGMVDKRTLEKYEREAREKSRESWYLSWALDTNQEERDKGKTVEVGRAFFETEKKHFTILDAPGHKSFVPNMIGGAAQADLAVLVISARKGEFETGFDRGGQTREHAMLAKTAGVKYLVVLVNKMDDPTVNWDEARYNECRDKILPYLKKLGFNYNKDLFFLPCSGQTGQGLKDQVDESICPWYRGPAFIPFIDDLPSLNRKIDGPFIMPIVDKYKDMGTVLMGKVESGECRKGQSLVIMPNRTPVTVDMLLSDDDEVNRIVPGENVKVKVKGVEEEDVSPGFVLCDAVNPIHTGRVFDAQLVILEHKSIICAGYSAVMHIHCAAEEVTVKALICLVDKKTGEKSKTRPRFVKQDQVAIMRIECAGVICLEPFKLFPQMGRFTLRDENKTIAIGKVLKLIE